MTHLEYTDNHETERGEKKKRILDLFYELEQEARHYEFTSQLVIMQSAKAESCTRLESIYAVLEKLINEL